MADLDQLRDDVKREALAASLAAGESIGTAAKSAGISVADAERLSSEIATIELVHERSPEVADELRALASSGDDPLVVLERAAKIAAKRIATQVQAGEVSAAVAKQLIELSLKLRAARNDKPPEINIYLPKTHVDPLIAACNEFNTLLASLLANDGASAENDAVAPS